MSNVWLFVRCLFWVGCFTGLIFFLAVYPAVWVVVHHFTKRRTGRG
jgi:hypothetical protein